MVTAFFSMPWGWRNRDLATDSIQLPTLSSVINDEQTYLQAIKSAQLKSNVALALAIVALVVALIAIFGRF